MAARDQVKAEMERLRSLCPSLFIENEKQWSGRVTAYFGKLRRFDIDAIQAACDRALDKYPGRFPDASRIAEFCKIVIAGWNKEASERADIAQRKREDAENRAHVMEKRKTVIPDTRKDQDRWVAEGKGPFDRQARRWEVESKNLGLEPNQATPREIGKRRMAELMKLVAEEGGTVPMPGGSKPRRRGDMPPGFFYDGSAPSSFKEHPSHIEERQPGEDDDREEAAPPSEGLSF